MLMEFQWNKSDISQRATGGQYRGSGQEACASVQNDALNVQELNKNLG